MSRLDAPAWVQAIGSIGAILVAVAVAWWQWHNTSKRELERERSLAYCKMDMVLCLAVEVSKIFEEAPTLDTSFERRRSFSQQFNHDRADRLRSALLQLGPADVTSGPSLLSVIDLQQSLDGLLDLMRCKKDGLESSQSGAFALVFTDFVRGHQQIYRSVRDAVDTLRKERDSHKTPGH